MTTREAIHSLIEAAVERPMRQTDDYFTAGGDSLSTIEIIDSVEARYDVQIEATIFFESRTVGEIIERIHGAIER